MRASWVSALLLVILVFTVALTFAQDNGEDSGTPKRVLKKYRVRRPVIVDDQGNVVRAGPRLRRVRVKNPRPTLETAAVVSPSPRQVISTSSSVSTTTPATTTSQSPSPQFQRQVQIVQQQQQPIQRQRILQQQQPQQQSTQPQPQQQSLYYEEQGIIEPVRHVPTFRQATSSANRDALLAAAKYKPSRGNGNQIAGEEDKKVGTTRNYSKINEDGSFTFGYEAEDGSFKEETRGVDCVVRGKYGYIDPEGVRREFEYVSGNPCDPNDPKDEAQEEEEEDSLAPSRPLLRQRVQSEISENNIQQGQHQTREERLPQDELVNFVRPVQRQRVRINQQHGGVIRQRVRITTPPPQTESPALIIRQRPMHQEPSQSLDSDRFGRVFNFDNEVSRLNSIARPASQPQPLYEQPFRQVQHLSAPSGRQVFGNQAFHQQQAQQEVPPRPTPTSATAGSNGITNSQFGRYRTELVYDPASGQYTSVLVQSNPNSGQEFELTQKLRAFPSSSERPSEFPSPSASPSPSSSLNSGAGGSYTQIQQFGQPQIQYYHPSTQPQQQQQQQQQQIPHGRSVQSAPIQQAHHQQSEQDPSQINQFLARHAYRVHQEQSNQQQQPQISVNNLQFIPPHLRPGVNQEAEIQRQEVREINIPSPSRQPQVLSANSAAQSTGQIDAFLRALNISI